MVGCRAHSTNSEAYTVEAVVYQKNWCSDPHRTSMYAWKDKPAGVASQSIMMPAAYSSCVPNSVRRSFSVMKPSPSASRPLNIAQMLASCWGTRVVVGLRVCLRWKRTQV